MTNTTWQVIEKTLGRSQAEPFLVETETGSSLSADEFLTATHEVSCALLDRLDGEQWSSSIQVALFGQNSLDAIVALFASWRIGARVLLIPEAWSPQVAESTLAAHKPDLVIAPTGISVDIPHVLLSELKHAGDTEKEMPDRQPELVTFTSGSTGQPKGVIHSLDNLISSAKALVSIFPAQSERRWLMQLPGAYMAGVLNSLIVPLVANDSVVVAPPFSPTAAARFWKTAADHQINAFWFTPTIAAMLLQLDRSTLGSEYCRELRPLCLSATSALRPALKREFEERYCALFETYGLSETLFVAANSPVLGDQAGSAGRLLPGVNACLDGDEGELLVKTPWMFLGYTCETPESRQKRERQDFYPTGDLARIDGDRITIEGRIKDLIIRGGINLSPGRIEDALLSQPEIREAAVFGIEDNILGEKVAAVILPAKELSRAEATRIARRATETLGREYAIDRIVVVDEIPKLHTGKIDRQRLAALVRNDK